MFELEVPELGIRAIQNQRGQAEFVDDSVTCVVNHHQKPACSLSAFLKLFGQEVNRIVELVAGWVLGDVNIVQAHASVRFDQLCALS